MKEEKRKVELTENDLAIICEALETAPTKYGLPEPARARQAVLKKLEQLKEEEPKYIITPTP